jgi:hypothetical protein
MERNLRLHEHVLRFLTVNLETEFNVETFQKRRADIQAASKRREEEREARREERGGMGGDRDRDRGDRDRGERRIIEAGPAEDAGAAEETAEE